MTSERARDVEPADVLRSVGVDAASAGERIGDVTSAVQHIAEVLGSKDSALTFVHAVGRTMDRMAAWHVSVAADATHGAVGRRADDVYDECADSIAEVLAWSWKAHLRAHAETDAARHQQPGTSPQMACVGFADLVSFTTLVARCTGQELAHLAQRFEECACDIVLGHGGRVVKTVGDEVLFETYDVDAAVSIACDIARTFYHAPDLPDIRTAIATGPVIERLGDVFGSTVNRASRLCASAAPHSVVIDRATQKLLVDADDCRVVPLGETFLRGLGWCEPYVVDMWRGESVLPREGAS